MIYAEWIEYRAVDLGVGAWYANSLGPCEVVAIQDLTGNPVVCPLSVQGIDYWITVAFNHVSGLSKANDNYTTNVSILQSLQPRRTLTKS